MAQEQFPVIKISRLNKIATFLLLGHRPVRVLSIDGIPTCEFANTPKLRADRRAYTRLTQRLERTSGKHSCLPDAAALAMLVAEARQSNE